MLNVLICQGVIPHYRKAVFDEIGKYVSLTVAYENEPACKGEHYQIVKTKLHKVPKVGVYHSGLVHYARKADVVISMLTFEQIDLNHLSLLAPNAKHICWGIGVPAAYNVRYDSLDLNYKYVKKINSCDAALFYSTYPKEKYKGLGINPHKLFVADNTVLVDSTNMQRTYEHLLFVGSLYPQKRVDCLIEQYHKAFQTNSQIPSLIIIGDGSERKKIEQMVEQLRLSNKVMLVGGITDEAVLRKYFASAIACISPDQAGLSVLKSMGYGVPYITLENAITGGEIFNIHDPKDGLLLKNFDEICDIILQTINERERFIKMGKEAKKYYDRERTVQHMAQGFIDAINYVMEAH